MQNFEAIKVLFNLRHSNQAFQSLIFQRMHEGDQNVLVLWTRFSMNILGHRISIITITGLGYGR